MKAIGLLVENLIMPVLREERPDLIRGDPYLAIPGLAPARWNRIGGIRWPRRENKKETIQ
jgi:hypothetical protein